MNFPVGTVVEYRGMIGTVSFATDTQMSIVVQSFPHDRVRDVKIIIHCSQYQEVQLINGNHQRD